MVRILTLLNRHDERFLHGLVLRRRSVLDDLMRLITHLGDAWVVIAISVLLAVGVVPGWTEVGYTAAFILTTSHLGVQLLKRTISRPRPRLPVGCLTLIDAPDRFSFPSGHAAASLSLAIPVAGALPTPIASVVVTAAMFVGISRCYLGVHYPGDVVMGWVLAALAAWFSGPAVSLLM